MMKYKLIEQKDGSHALSCHGQLKGRPKNAEIQFWLQYRECVDLLREIQEELQAASHAALETNDQSGPWLPVDLCVRIGNITKEAVTRNE